MPCSILHYVYMMLWLYPHNITCWSLLTQFKKIVMQDDIGVYPPCVLACILMLVLQWKTSSVALFTNVGFAHNGKWWRRMPGIFNPKSLIQHSLHFKSIWCGHEKSVSLPVYSHVGSLADIACYWTNKCSWWLQRLLSILDEAHNCEAFKEGGRLSGSRQGQYRYWEMNVPIGSTVVHTVRLTSTLECRAAHEVTPMV